MALMTENEIQSAQTEILKFPINSNTQAFYAAQQAYATFEVAKQLAHISTRLDNINTSIAEV